MIGRIADVWQLPRIEFWREVLTFAAVGSIFLLLELLGRWNHSELFDAASAMVLLLTFAMAYSWHRRFRLRWTRVVKRMFRQTIKRAQTWRFEWGLDLRCEPAVERACPPFLRMLPMVLAGISLAAIAWSVSLAESLGFVVRNISYVVYLLGLVALWTTMVTIILVGAFLPAWTLMDMVKSHTNLPERKAARAGLFLTLGYFTIITAAALLLPLGVATSLLAALVLLSLVLPQLPGAWYPDCLWRNRKGDREIRSISLGTLFSLQLVCVALLPLTCVLLALGPEALWSTAGESAAPISSALGQTTAWLGSGGLVVFLGLFIGHLGVALWHDPSRRVATSLHISGVQDADKQREIRESFARQRKLVRFAPQSPRRCDVTVRITDDSDALAISESEESISKATFAVPMPELEQPQFQERIARRDVIQRRRMLMSGLESIFRRAKSRKDRSGSGYWVAPHYWFVDGLTRDETDDTETNVLDVIPPLYYKAFPRAARHHFFEISRALQVDLLYVEDGVDFRSLKRVLRVMFERYDIDGGRQPLADIHFAGLPKVRVMLHDYNFEEPALKTKYPEPDYQHLGRVRILHVFRDRGEDEPQEITPEEPDWLFTPDDSPVLVG